MGQSASMTSHCCFITVHCYCDFTSCSTYDSSSVMNACKGVNLAIVTLGTGKVVLTIRFNHSILFTPGSVLESEGNDRAEINLPGQQLKLLQDAASSAQGESA